MIAPTASPLPGGCRIASAVGVINPQPITLQRHACRRCSRCRCGAGHCAPTGMSSGRHACRSMCRWRRTAQPGATLVWFRPGGCTHSGTSPARGPGPWREVRFLPHTRQVRSLRRCCRRLCRRVPYGRMLGGGAQPPGRRPLRCRTAPRRRCGAAGRSRTALPRSRRPFQRPPRCGPRGWLRRRRRRRGRRPHRRG